LPSLRGSAVTTLPIIPTYIAVLPDPSSLSVGLLFQREPSDTEPNSSHDSMIAVLYYAIAEINIQTAHAEHGDMGF
jgi:hypothetical protein